MIRKYLRAIWGLLRFGKVQAPFLIHCPCCGKELALRISWDCLEQRAYVKYLAEFKREDKGVKQ